MARGHKGECVPGEGRPSKLTTLDYGFLQFLIAEKGFTDSEVAMVLGINEDTFHEWKLKNKKFSESVKKFKSLANRRVERSLYERAIGYSHEEDKIFCNADGLVTTVKTKKHYPPDTAAAKNWLANRTRKEKDPWTDKQEITGEGGGPITIQISQREAKI